MRLQTRIAVVAAFAVLAPAQPVAKRKITLFDLPETLQLLFPDFDGNRVAVERDTAARLAEGEKDHLIFYLLQSRRFTAEARIEPALSAKTFQETELIPAEVLRRTTDFLKAAPNRDERLDYFRRSFHLDQEEIISEYRRVMRSLYRKEFAGGHDWYQSRGHSSDTQIEANYAVWMALRVLRSIRPEWKVSRALIVGPGLDFAPRTGLFDEAPQSYQPYILADALLGLRLSTPASVRIHCVDINPRVVSFLNDGKARSLRIHSTPSDEGYAEYLLQAGRAIGVKREDFIDVRDEISSKITASLLNLITERITQPKFDLIVVTNVLLYFNSKELALALSNIDSMLQAGGFVIANDARPEIDEYTAAIGMKPVQARTIRVSGPAGSPLFDSFAIYAK